MQTQGVPTSELMAGTSNAENNLHKVRLQDDANYSSYSRNSATEIDFLFPRLPNPTLVMYVFPHMSPAGVPVPGYSTAFTLFEKTEYALPGEM